MYIYSRIMRDIIWTIIVVWLILKVISIFKSFSNRTQQPSSSQEQQQNFNPDKSPKDLESAIRNRMNKEGEYVEFEEIK